MARNPRSAPTGTSRRVPSVADVARVAGVSAQTVSRVSNGSPAVLPSTRELVLEAMAAVGYTPNATARALRRGSSRVIGLIAYQISRTGEARTIEAVVEAARAAGYTVSLVDVEQATNPAMEAAAHRLGDLMVDGLVLIRHEHTTSLDLQVPANMPLVVADSSAEAPHTTVGADEHAGAVAAVHHLLDLGHRTVHHLSGPRNARPATLRREAWQHALIERGREVPEAIPGNWSAASGYRAGTELARDPQVTAVFCANDEMAQGLLRALHEHGRAVPGEVSVIGFDNIPLAAHLIPPLTTIAQDFNAIGTHVVQRLLDQVRDGAGSGTGRVVVPVELIVRASSGPPPTA